ncbi:hypothetical protein QBC46DRAFT_425450 [Diplogelasinospora grovesii]|uniref:Methyltransferase domain-containing protein n=1 Tax=Diplogelasinospora grovesii TaxID=303347 RepID=A0AAN6MWY9_9PEZI|nr:hypothetical protein QBC46DRAFT_425450 [Diplogelasinospora grovesii]
MASHDQSDLDKDDFKAGGWNRLTSGALKPRSYCSVSLLEFAKGSSPWTRRMHAWRFWNRAIARGLIQDPYNKDDEFEPREVRHLPDLLSAEKPSLASQEMYRHGWRYYAYEHSRFMILDDLQDEAVQDQVDIEGLWTALMMEVTDGKLFFAPCPISAPLTVVDWSEGKGLWAVEMGLKFPETSIFIRPNVCIPDRRIPLELVRSGWLPPNVQPWPTDWDLECDLFRLRGDNSLHHNPFNELRMAFKHLKPGGWVEFQEWGGYPMCDDDTMADGDAVAVEDFGQYLQSTGFVNIERISYKVPFGRWPENKRERLIGEYARQIVARQIPSVGRNLVDSSLHYDEVVDTFFRIKAATEPHGDGAHRYYEFVIWFAQKPKDLAALAEEVADKDVGVFPLEDLE